MILIIIFIYHFPLKVILFHFLCFNWLNVIVFIKIEGVICGILGWLNIKDVGIRLIFIEHLRWTSCSSTVLKFIFSLLSYFMGWRDRYSYCHFNFSADVKIWILEFKWKFERIELKTIFGNECNDMIDKKF